MAPAGVANPGTVDGRDKQWIDVSRVVVTPTIIITTMTIVSNIGVIVIVVIIMKN